VAGILQKSDTVCNGDNADTIRLTGQLGNVTNWIRSTNAGVTWASITNTNTTLPYLNITQTTLFAVVVKSGACLADTSPPVNIAIVNANLADAGADKTITQFESVQLDGSGYGTPEWSPNTQLSDPNIFKPIVNPLHTTTYVLTLTDEHSCSSKDSVVINVIVPIPSAITPNGDGVNDYFLIDKIEDYPQNSLSIFNRWGNVVYKESPYKNSWNGKSTGGHELPDEIYYYALDYGNGDKPISGYILIKR
jgi:gliding motility-associated-like protein